MYLVSIGGWRRSSSGEPYVVHQPMPKANPMIAAQLSTATLQSLTGDVKRPSYDPATITPGIVHLGLGGFHRAHMARYTHDLLQQDDSSMRWGIMGAGLLPQARAMQEALRKQDWLYTLTECDTGQEQVGVIGSLTGMICGGGDLLDAMADPATAIVSLTVSEDGYCLDASKQLNTDHPLVTADLADPHRRHLRRAGDSAVDPAHRGHRDHHHAVGRRCPGVRDGLRS